MKQILLLTILFFSTTNLSAQNQERGKRGEDPHKFQMELIISQLNIEGAQKEQFKEVYSRYGEEMKGLHPRRSSRSGKLTEEQIEEQILQSFEISDKINSLKKEYYKEFRAILTPHQILKMYNTERRFKERMNSELQRRAGSRFEGDKVSGKSRK